MISKAGSAALVAAGLVLVLTALRPLNVLGMFGRQAAGPKVGDLAPDFSLRGSTKDGAMAQPLRLADFRGQAVVLAFFPKSRTKG